MKLKDIVIPALTTLAVIGAMKSCENKPKDTSESINETARVVDNYFKDVLTAKTTVEEMTASFGPDGTTLTMEEYYVLNQAKKILSEPYIDTIKYMQTVSDTRIKSQLVRENSKGWQAFNASMEILEKLLDGSLTVLSETELATVKDLMKDLNTDDLKIVESALEIHEINKSIQGNK
jgi:hypothetical protein